MVIVVLNRALEEQKIFIWKRMCNISCNVSTFIFSYYKLSLSFLCYWFGLNDFHGDSHGMWDDKRVLVNQSSATYAILVASEFTLPPQCWNNPWLDAPHPCYNVYRSRGMLLQPKEAMIWPVQFLRLTSLELIVMARPPSIWSRVMCSRILKIRMGNIINLPKFSPLSSFLSKPLTWPWANSKC